MKAHAIILLMMLAPMVGCATYREAQAVGEVVGVEAERQGVGQLFDVMDVALLIKTYHALHDEWPADAEALRVFAAEHELLVPLDEYRDLAFDVHPGGTMDIAYITPAGDRVRAEGVELTIDAADEDIGILWSMWRGTPDEVTDEAGCR